MPETVKRALAAVMFTDMVGYTALMQTDEAAALVARQRHREVLEMTHRNFHGKILQYFGDGTLSVFESVVEAVCCAIAIQTALQQAPKVPLRIGIHTGDIVFTENDVIGDGVNIASRLESLAVPGSVFISAKVLDYLENQKNIDAKSIGWFELKNVAKPMEIFAIANSGLVVPDATEIAGKGKLWKSAKHNLPVSLSSFIGREREIVEIKSLALQQRLVTLTGPGGTGKTRLSIVVAEELSDHFADGVYFVPLAPLRDPELLASAVAKALSIEETPRISVMESIKDFMAHQELLLILDNFEQITEAAWAVLSLLQHCAKLKFIVTSRTTLGIEGEQEYPVPPLVTPNIKRVVNIDLLRQFPSVRLFIQRAKAIKPGFNLTTGNAYEVAEICNRLDGLPLAIELAAARIRLFSPALLLNKLSHSLEVLQSREKGRPQRHQTLRQTIDWSFELLDQQEKILFQQLSVFTGNFTLEAVERICQVDSWTDAELLNGVEALLTKSLIRQIQGLYEEPRFILLETIREYAADQLHLAQQTEALKQRHAQYFLRLTEAAASELTGKDQGLWFNKIESHNDNIRAAIIWAIEKQDAETALRLGNAMWRFWIVRNKVEGRQRLEQILYLPFEEGLLAYRAQTLSAMGAVLNSADDPKLAQQLLKESLSIFESINDGAGMATCLNHLSNNLILRCHYQQAAEQARKAMQLGQALGMERVVSTSYNNLGWLSSWRCQLNDALEFYEKGMQIRKRIGDRRGYAYMMTGVAFGQGRLGYYEKGQTNLEEAIQILEDEVADRQLVAWAKVMLAENLTAQGRWPEAIPLYQESVNSWDQVINIFAQSFTLLFFADALQELGQGQLARQKLEKADAIIEHYDSPWLTGNFLKVKARLAFKEQQWEEINILIKKAFKTVRTSEDYISMAELLELSAQVRVGMKDADGAAHALTCAKVLREKKRLPLPPRFAESFKQLVAALQQQLGPAKITAMEKHVSASFDEEMKRY